MEATAADAAEQQMSCVDCTVGKHRDTETQHQKHCDHGDHCDHNGLDLGQQKMDKADWFCPQDGGYN